ncbi:MAG: nuclease [Citromicrobium sp.]|nr:nuclease [Citromicrobium sp.]
MGDPVSFRRPSFRSASHRDPGARPAAPLRKTKRAAWWDAARGLGLVLVAAPLAVFTAILLHDGLPGLSATPQSAQAAAEVQRVDKRFGPCIGGERHTCVVDGDTIWLNDVKIRIADIDAPEVFSPDCPAEREAGLRATARLTQWLNAGAFEVLPNPDGRDADRYGRKLRVLARGGTSAVDALVAEGVATRWGGAGRSWC